MQYASFSFSRDLHTLQKFRFSHPIMSIRFVFPFDVVAVTVVDPEGGGGCVGGRDEGAAEGGGGGIALFVGVEDVARRLCGFIALFGGSACGGIADTAPTADVKVAALLLLLGSGVAERE